MFEPCSQKGSVSTLEKSLRNQEPPHGRKPFGAANNFETVNIFGPWTSVHGRELLGRKRTLDGESSNRELMLYMRVLAIFLFTSHLPAVNPSHSLSSIIFQKHPFSLLNTFFPLLLLRSLLGSSNTYQNTKIFECSSSSGSWTIQLGSWTLMCSWSVNTP